MFPIAQGRWQQQKLRRWVEYTAKLRLMLYGLLWCWLAEVSHDGNATMTFGRYLDSVTESPLLENGFTVQIFPDTVTPTIMHIYAINHMQPEKATS